MTRLRLSRGRRPFFKEGFLLTDVRVRTPKIVPGRGDLRGVPLSPTDGFVLSRIDGVSDEHQIVAVTGLPGPEVQASLAKLELLGVVNFDAQSNSSAQPSPAIAASPTFPTSPVSTGSPGERMTPSAAGLAEDVDLDEETRRQVLQMHDALKRADHYALLGVDSKADKKALRRAYFELAAKFHPDRYFRKKLGSFKPRMETIFGRITLAHETLSSKESREEYDAYLEEQRRTRGIEQLLADAAIEAKRAEETIEREVRAHTPLAVPSSSAPPSGTPGPAVSLVSPPPGAPTPGAPSTPTAPGVPAVPGVPMLFTPSRTVDDTARRESLARRLLGGRAAASSAPPPRASISPPSGQSVAEAMDSLRRRYEERVLMAKTSQARKYAENAQTALAQGDPVAAANALRVALSLAPSDPELQRQALVAQGKADAVLGDMYARQAAYEEKTGRWQEAANSWTRVCKARPGDADAHEHAAAALVKAGGDLHEAGRLADRACALEPKNARYRVTLANVYLAAGLTLNALRELETAAQLAPHDGTIQATMKRIRSRG